MKTFFPAFEGASQTTRSRGTVSSTYLATVALWGRNADASTDAWGNVKVPFPGEIEAAAASGIDSRNPGETTSRVESSRTHATFEMLRVNDVSKTCPHSRESSNPFHLRIHVHNTSSTAG